MLVTLLFFYELIFMTKRNYREHRSLKFRLTTIVWDTGRMEAIEGTRQWPWSFFRRVMYLLRWAFLEVLMVFCGDFWVLRWLIRAFLRVVGE